jgi:dsRNA-specific ribonuclease
MSEKYLKHQSQHQSQQQPAPSIPMNMIDDDVRVEKNQYGIDIFVFDPYNPLNKLISEDELHGILRTYGINIPIMNYTLYKRAFIHQSYIKRPSLENEYNKVVICPKPDNCLPIFTKSNERLEFIGDGVLECITKYYLYRRFPKENEGFMTEKKIALVKNESIGKMAFDMGLHKWFVLSKHAEMKQTRTNLKKLGCLFESFIGAIFLDFNKVTIDDEDALLNGGLITGSGFQMAQIFIESVFEKHVDWIHLIRNDDNYKNILQVKIQKEFKVTPDYMEMEVHTADIGYKMGVYLTLNQPIHAVQPRDAISIHSFTSYQDIHEYMSIYGKIFVYLGEGTHKIKKKAEQMACENAIRNLQNFV